MSADVTIKWTGSVAAVVQAKFDRMKATLGDAVKVEQGRVKQRTQAGTGLNASFMGYSDSWAEVRRKKKLRTDIVDLTFTGRMFDSMRTDVTDQGPTKVRAVVSFGSNEFSKLKAAANHKLRPFFGFSKEQRDIILNKLRTTK